MKKSAWGAPVFLVGPVRSGSTFLRLMLNAHPSIINPGECDFLFDQVSDDGITPEMAVYRHWLSFNRIFQSKHLKIDPALDYPGLMNSFIDQFSRDDAVLMLNVHRHFHRIPKVFPKARFIHLLRDPRDVARSCIGMGWVGHVYYGVDIWREAELSWEKVKPMLSEDQFLEIRYEDLLEDVEAGLTKICHFLGLEYTDQMMNYASSSSYELPNKNLSYQWKKRYSHRELQLVEGKVGEMLVARGYELGGAGSAHPGWFEKVALAVGNKFFRFRFQVDRYGIGLYVENFLASRLGIGRWQEMCQKKMNLIDLQFLK